jgi:hypothetical protein
MLPFTIFPAINEHNVFYVFACACVQDNIYKYELAHTDTMRMNSIRGLHF